MNDQWLNWQINGLWSEASCDRGRGRRQMGSSDYDMVHLCAPLHKACEQAMPAPCTPTYAQSHTVCVWLRHIRCCSGEDFQEFMAASQLQTSCVSQFMPSSFVCKSFLLYCQQQMVCLAHIQKSTSVSNRLKSYLIQFDLT